MAWSDWASVVVTGGLGLAGLYFANSLKRRARQDLDREVAEKRFAAYGSMWTHMIKASPMNAIELAEASHTGSLADAGNAQDDGRMIDRPIVVRALETIAFAEAVALKEDRIEQLLSA